MLENPVLPPHPTILAAYDLGQIRSAKPLGGGMFLTPWLLTTDRGRVVFRGTEFRQTLPAFRFQAQTMNQAAAGGVRCPRVIPDRSGACGHPLDNAVWAVHEYLDGTLYGWSRWCAAMEGPSAFPDRLGCEVAFLHDRLAEIQPEGDPSLSTALPPIQFAALQRIRDHWERGLATLAGAPPSEAGEARAALLHLRGRIDAHWDWLLRTADSRGIGAMPTQPVHGDVSPVNLVFAEGASRIGLIDWDCVHLGHRLYDALGDVVIRPPVDEARFQRLDTGPVRRYLESYRRSVARPPSPEEIACVPAFCMARQLEDLRQRLHVLPHLPQRLDREYAALIRIRVTLMDQIRGTDRADWGMSGG